MMTNLMADLGKLSEQSVVNLMSMTTFENRAERDKHWQAFGKDTAWKNLSDI